MLSTLINKFDGAGFSGKYTKAGEFTVGKAGHFYFILDWIAAKVNSSSGRAVGMVNGVSLGATPTDITKKNQNLVR